MSISFFWLERGGGWGSSPSTNPADHQKLNVIQKWAFNFLAGEGWWMGFESIDQPGQSSEVEPNPKTRILFIWLERDNRWGSSPSTSHTDHQKLNVIQKWAFYFVGWRGVADGVLVHQPAGQSSGFECNPKMSILFFWLERGGGWGLSPLTSPADHQKLNVIQKWAFNFFGWRAVVHGVPVHRPAQPNTRIWT